MENLVRLRRVAENGLKEPESKEAMVKLRGINNTYHWCPDWDFMVICDEDPEFEACTCDFLDKKP